MRRATSLMHTFEIKNMFNLSVIMLLKLMTFICVEALILLLLFLEQARGRPTWSVRATWCPRDYNNRPVAAKVQF